MAKNKHLPTAALAFITFLLVSCGPETNSRHGDQYWDPNKTKEKFDPIDVPNYQVTYKEPTTGDFDAYVAIDYSDLSRQSKSGVVSYYTRGISGERDISDLLQGSSTFTDTSFLNNLETATDYRLRANQPGNYTIVLDFDVVWPNGNTISYLIDDITFTVPGCQTNFEFYSDYINPVIAENCVSCHSNLSDARAAFDLSGSVDARRAVFLPKTTATVGSLSMLDYIFNDLHTGSSTAADITGDELTAFRAFISTLAAIDADAGDTRDITTDFTFAETDTAYQFCLPQPTTFVIEN